MRLWVRLALALALVGVVPLLTLAWVVIGTAEQQAEQVSRLTLEREAQIEADRLGQWTIDQANFLAGWTRPYKGRLVQMDPELMSALLNAVYIARPWVVIVAMVDADGVAVTTPAFSEKALGRELAEGRRAELLVSRIPISDAISGGVAIGEPYLPQGERVLSVAVAAVATDIADGMPTDEVLLIAAEIQLDLVAALDASSTDQRAYALLNGRGDVLMGGDHPLVDIELVRALGQIAGGNANFSYPKTNPEVVGGLAPVVGTEWKLVVVQPAELEQAVFRPVRRQIMGLLVFLVAISLLLGWRLAIAISDPVEALRDSVLAVADGDYGQRSAVETSDEVGELARAFNHMSARLAINQQEIAEQHEQILGFNEELQDRVDRRTAQLVDAQAQLMRSGQLAAVAEVGAGLAHELNNPLAAILGSTQLLKARATSEAQRRSLESLEEQAQRCRDVVAAMVRFSSGEEVDPANAPVVDLRDVLTEVTTLIQGPFRQRGVTLQLDIPEAPLRVRVDPVHGSRILAQVLNGLRAGLTHGTTLEVTAYETDDEVMVVMTPDFPVAIDEFRRDDWMASGMGLWVARRLLDQLGGRLEQPVKVPWVSGMKPPRTEEYTEDDPSLPLLQDATWRVAFPRA